LLNLSERNLIDSRIWQLQAISSCSLTINFFLMKTLYLTLVFLFFATLAGAQSPANGIVVFYGANPSYPTFVCDNQIEVCLNICWDDQPCFFNTGECMQVCDSSVLFNNTTVSTLKTGITASPVYVCQAELVVKSNGCTWVHSISDADWPMESWQQFTICGCTFKIFRGTTTSAQLFTIWPVQ
jgi:hypothetical protein